MQCRFRDHRRFKCKHTNGKSSSDSMESLRFRYFKYKENICTVSILVDPNDLRHLPKSRCVSMICHIEIKKKPKPKQQL